MTSRLKVLPSASKIDRAVACAASILLPQWPDPPSPWAERGTAMHRYLELYARLGHAAAIREVPEEWRDDCAELDVDGLPVGADYEKEVALAYDVAKGTARRISRPDEATHTYADAREGELPMMLDVAKRGEVGDYKSGVRGTYVWQLRVNALAWSALTGSPDVTATLYRLADRSNDQVFRWDSLDLAAFSAELQEHVAHWRAVEARGVRDDDIKPGAHCDYCPARRACPAKVGFVADARTGALVRHVNKLVTDEDVAATYHFVREASAELKRVLASIYALARERPVDLGDGTMLASVPSKREALDGEVTYRAVKEILGVGAAELAVTFSGSKAGVKRAVKHAASGLEVSQAETQRKILAAIRERGGVTLKTSERVEIVPKLTG